MQKFLLKKADGTEVVLEANKTVANWLWNNYFTLGFEEINNLSLMPNYRKDLM